MHDYIASVHFEDDRLLTMEDKRRLSSGRGGSGLVQPERDSTGRWIVRRDIFLGRGVPEYP